MSIITIDIDKLPKSSTFRAYCAKCNNNYYEFNSDIDVPEGWASIRQVGELYVCWICPFCIKGDGTKMEADHNILNIPKVTNG